MNAEQIKGIRLTNTRLMAAGRSTGFRRIGVHRLFDLPPEVLDFALIVAVTDR
jgi:hypothetical protein